MRLDGRVALITGGGSGIGRAIAHRFAEEGARVIVNDLRKETAEATARDIGNGARALAADVADSAQVLAMVEEVDRAFGGLDILVNNAGIGEAGGEPDTSAKAEARLSEMMAGKIETHWDVTVALTDAAWTRMLAVHLDGTFYCTREALRLMSKRNRGAIVNLSSVAALTGLEVVPHYSAAKGAILSFTRAVARDVASRGIRVNAICPGYIDTPMTERMSPLIRTAVIARTPLRRTGEPHEVAATALFLASDDSSFFTGQWLSPNGGLFVG